MFNSWFTDKIKMVSDSVGSLDVYFKILGGKATAKYLDCDILSGKVEEAFRILSSCVLCERRCGVDRMRGEKGFCGVLEPRISSEFLHFGEEAELVPSYTIFSRGVRFPVSSARTGISARIQDQASN